MRAIFVLLFSVLSLSACSNSGNHSDLVEFIRITKEKPAGKIEPIPTYPPYENFIYASASLRSPFDKPIDIQQRRFSGKRSNVSPDFNRVKEHLEGFDFASLSMVGTLRKGDSLWALVRDSSGGISRVATGNYVGKNHGRIVAVDGTKIELIEIVSDGLDGWVERPRLLALANKE